MSKYLKTLRTLIAGGYHTASAVEVIVSAFALSRDDAAKLVRAAREMTSAAA